MTSSNIDSSTSDPNPPGFHVKDPDAIATNAGSNSLSLAQPHILLVDDEPAVTSALERELEDFDYTLTSVDRGSKAIEILERETVDLVISDMRMPEMSGSELLERIADRWPDTGRILLTGFADLKSVTQAVNKGRIFYYIKKPWDREELAEVLSDFFEQKTLEDEGVRESQRLQEKNETLEKEKVVLEQLSLIDALTGIANRRAFDTHLAKEINRARRRNGGLSLLMADIDYFKKYNDTLGHQAGDECLKLVAKKIADSFLRGGDIPARYGGEEFAIILADTYGEDVAHRAAEYMRLSIDELKLDHPSSGVSEHITMSIGVATLDLENDQRPADLIAKADKALYIAKEMGRNRVSVYSFEME